MLGIRACWIRVERTLLCLVDREILNNDLMALAVEFFAPGGSDGGELMSERPELMAAGCRLRRDAVIDLEAPLALGLEARGSVRGGGDASFPAGTEPCYPQAFA